MRVALGADHAGVSLKQHLAAWLPGCRVTRSIDLGTHSTEPVDYPDYAEAVGRAVLDGRADRGLIVCGSGVGACIAANKLPGIRAGLCHDTYSAAQGVLHDDANVLVLGARVIGPALAEALVTAFLGARFTNAERHVRRLAKMRALEARALDAHRDGQGLMSVFEQLPQPLRGDVEAAAAAWQTAAARRACGRATRRCGPARTKRDGSAG